MNVYDLWVTEAFLIEPRTCNLLSYVNQTRSSEKFYRISRTILRLHVWLTMYRRIPEWYFTTTFTTNILDIYNTDVLWVGNVRHDS